MQFRQPSIDDSKIIVSSCIIHFLSVPKRDKTANGWTVFFVVQHEPQHVTERDQ